MTDRLYPQSVSPNKPLDEIAAILARGYLRLMEKRNCEAALSTGLNSSKISKDGLDVFCDPSPNAEDVNSTRNQKRFIHGGLS